MMIHATRSLSPDIKSRGGRLPDLRPRVSTYPHGHTGKPELFRWDVPGVREERAYRAYSSQFGADDLWLVRIMGLVVVWFFSIPPPA